MTPIYTDIPELTMIPWRQDDVVSPCILRCPECGGIAIIGAAILALYGAVLHMDICCKICWEEKERAVRLQHYPNHEVMVHVCR